MFVDFCVRLFPLCCDAGEICVPLRLRAKEEVEDAETDWDFFVGLVVVVVVDGSGRDD